MSKPIKQKPNYKNLNVTAVGLRFYVTPDTMKMLDEHAPLLARLEREPTNDFDPNAIKVILEAEPWQGFHIGHISKQTAAVLAPRMDKGMIVWEAWLLGVDPIKGDAEFALKVSKGQG